MCDSLCHTIASMMRFFSFVSLFIFFLKFYFILLAEGASRAESGYKRMER